MTKEEWYNWWRNKRIEEKKNAQYVNTTTYISMLKELYNYDYTPKEEAFLNLVSRYEKKLSSSYFKKVDEIKIIAEKRAKDRFRAIINAPNPFFSLLQKEPKDWGKPIPIIFGDS